MLSVVLQLVAYLCPILLFLFIDSNIINNYCKTMYNCLVGK